MPATAQRPGGRSARVRTAVLDATIQLLLEQGLDGTTVPAVAQRSGVHHTSIYRRWNDRGALIRDALLETMDTEAPIPDTGNIRGDLITLLESVIGIHCTPLGSVLIDLARSRDEPLTELTRSYWTARTDHLGVVIDRAIDRGEVRPGIDRRLVIEFVEGAILSRGLASDSGLASLDPNQVADMLLNGIAAPPGR